MYIETKDAPAAIGAYSQGVMKRDTLYVSGQLPLTTDGTLKTDIEDATQQCLNNVLAVVKAAGLRKEDIVRCGIFLKNMEDFSAANELYGRFFGNHKPARAAVGVAALPKGACIEIDAVAER